MSFTKKQYNWSFERVKKTILSNIGKGNPSEWLNKEYEELSLDIKLKTNVLISPSTLKRIFGKSKTPDKYYPQKATLQALTEYAESYNQNNKIYSKFYSRKAILTYIIFITISISSVFIFYKSENGNLNFDSTLILSKLDGTTPASAFFEYHIPNTNDNYYIDFGDERISNKLDPEKNKITYCYRYPGVLKAKILRDKEVTSKEVDVFVPTNDWRAFTYYYRTPHTERFFYPVPIEKASNDGIFYPSAIFLSSIGIDTTKTIMMQLANFTKTRTNGDAFHFKTRLKEVGFWAGTQCYYTFIEIAGTKGHILVMLTNRGCSHWAILELSEKIYDGKNFDLSDFILNKDEWKEISIINNDKDVEIFVNENKIHHEKYENSIGNIAGISIIFLANGYVDYVKLFDSKDRLIIGNDF
jgi:hypothetical protein